MIKQVRSSDLRKKQMHFNFGSENAEETKLFFISNKAIATINANANQTEHEH